MIVKTVMAGALPLALLPPVVDFGPVKPAKNPYVAQVVCENGRGTAFKIDTGQWVTVKHVSENGGCKINGQRIYVEHADGPGDFAIIDIGSSSPGGLKVNCDGFRDGEWYHGIGFGNGVSQSKSVKYSSFYSLLKGGLFAALTANRFVPGMSGGPVLNSAGEVVGTVNSYGIEQPISFSRELRKTKLCQKSNASDQA